MNDFISGTSELVRQLRVQVEDRSYTVQLARCTGRCKVAPTEFDVSIHADEKGYVLHGASWDGENIGHGYVSFNALTPADDDERRVLRDVASRALREALNTA